MSDDPYADEEEAPPHPADPPRGLDNFVSSFTDPAAQEVMRDAAVRIQDYMVRRQIADDNAAAGDRLVNNLGQFRDGLVGMVSNDPAALSLGFDLVPDVVRGITESHPFLPNEQREAVHEQLTLDMQRSIAHAGVMSLADRNEAAARGMLDSDRVSGVLSDQDRAGLNGYISAQALARGMDAEALAQQRQVDEVRLRGYSATNYVGALLHPDTGELQFPAGWAQRVLKDPTLDPGSSAVMLDMYSRLRRDGDAPLSDPFLMADLITRAARGDGYSPMEVFQQAGTSLALTDAMTLAPLGTPQPMGNRNEVQALAATIGSYRDQVVTPENGPAGVAAFERFVNWVVPAFRNGGSFSNPEADNYVLSRGDGAGQFWNHFAPRLDDLVRSEQPPGQEERPSLDQIFGRR